ncbi:MoaD/ThiS family protein [Alteromonas oceanisediminis]|uniref:MoaD/ThiS family protein n=1 Tax=Alteromonas oceanisediminis TaxID=2836180 RepID=UPI001BDA0F33|nr:MoaD/ThiS family protein [Alteromonas oceanisediminis]MBT0587340.1 MoaD/ThiS family protein [Alteromonas oceanisediminis]
MIQVLFFAHTRQLLKSDGVSLDAEPGMTVQTVLDSVSERFDNWDLVDADNLMCARNHTLVTRDTAVISGDTIAFFPPVTGG